MEQMHTDHVAFGECFFSPMGWPSWPIYEDDPAAEFEAVPTLSAPFTDPGLSVTSYHG